MTNLVKKIRKADERAFNTWFNRWEKQYQLENQVLQSASKGYSAVKIFDSDNCDDYQKRRFTDTRFIKRLRESYPDLTIESKDETKVNVFNHSRVVKTIIVRWDGASNEN